jgi:two-component system, chemotaxis family, CheB/CheR fusion protein
VQGEHFLNLDSGIPLGTLREPLRAALAGASPEPVELKGHNRRGQPIRVAVTFAQLHSHDGDPDGAIVAMTAERDEG